MSEIVVYHDVLVPRIGRVRRKTASPMVELTGRLGYRADEMWVEINWFEDKYKSFLDIFRNKTYRVTHTEWIPNKDVLYIMRK